MALAQSGMFTDPFRTAKWRAVQGDFMAWVERVEQEHLQNVKAGEAALVHEEHDKLAAGNTIVVGAGGYERRSLCQRKRFLHFKGLETQCLHMVIMQIRQEALRTVRQLPFWRMTPLQLESFSRYV
ncbi:hypothetical protein KC19_VG209700 [Ceratodon purpureus]|uniref:Uncharacterized protein n=1 Tax=Ceratodon purpureus TaxID=3225 RepID=A0A8T0HSI1_CERPU|nr:hypothetical protein KC19_VG209700 [Ceratodon purpureus]